MNSNFNCSNGQLKKFLCRTPIFYKLLNFRSQIENHVINYRIMGASSFSILEKKYIRTILFLFLFQTKSCTDHTYIRTIFVFLFQRVKPVQILLKSELFFQFQEEACTNITHVRTVFVEHVFWLLFVIYWVALAEFEDLWSRYDISTSSRTC